MMRILKYQIQIVDQQTVMMPAGAQPLDVQMQGDACYMWALCDEGAPKELRRFSVYGTGHPVRPESGKYIATFQMHSGALVFHVFEDSDETP